MLDPKPRDGKRPSDRSSLSKRFRPGTKEMVIFSNSKSVFVDNKYKLYP